MKRVLPRPRARLHPTQEVRALFGAKLGRLLEKASAEIEAAGLGKDLHYHRFEFAGATLALASRTVIEIEVGFCGGRTPKVTIPAKPVSERGQQSGRKR
jgi:hypothetical protein